MKFGSAFSTYLGLLLLVGCSQRLSQRLSQDFPTQRLSQTLAQDSLTHAVSLKVLQEELQECQQANNCSDQHLHLGGLTTIANKAHVL